MTFKITSFIVLVLLSLFVNCFGLQRPPPVVKKNCSLLKSSLKESFISKARFNNPLAKDKDSIDSLLDQICALAPKTQSSLNDLGMWQICYAPHILALQSLLFTSFKVYYNFSGLDQLESNVFYSSNIFGQGWLNTKGRFTIENSSLPEIETQKRENVCSITWYNIWWDVNTEEHGPSGSDEREQHILSDAIQSIGRIAFIEKFSQFPIQHWDTDLAFFKFPLTSTRIAACRLPKRPWC